MALHFLVQPPVTAVAGETVELTGAEAHHAATVRRVRVGEKVTVGDGAGVWLEGVVSEIAPRRVVVTVESRRQSAPPERRVVLVQALAKGDRDELAIQAATELGADEIVPWQAARSISRWSGPKLERGLERWSTIVRESAKQAHRHHLPTVSAPVGTSELARRAGTSAMLVLEPTAADRLSDIVLDAALDDGPVGDVIVVVGPEGGIAPEELAALEAAGARLVRLGDTVLRTSTAGPAALGVVNVRLSRW